MDNNGELSEKELEFAQGGQRGKYEDNKERFESAMNKFKPVPEGLKQDRDLVQASIENNLEPGELTEEQLSHVEAGNGLSYADNKKRMGNKWAKKFHLSGYKYHLNGMNIL